MKTQLADEAVELGTIVARVLERAGGFELVARAEQDSRAEQRSQGEDVSAGIAQRLGSAGVWELEPRSQELDAEAAAAVCRAAGRYALPYPVAERLAADPTAGIDALALVSPQGPRVNLCLPELRWSVSDGLGRHAPVLETGPPLGTKLGALTGDVQLGEWVEGDDYAPLALVLPCWTLLGMCESAFDMTRRHLLDRHQFGKALASFQALQFRLADTASAMQGFVELAKYTLWSVASGQPERQGDAIALRLAALETAETVFRTAHQMHGAMGFCDEVPLSWLSRYSQPIRRLPWGRSQTEAHLLRSIESVPFAGLFSGTDDLGSVLVQ